MKIISRKDFCHFIRQGRKCRDVSGDPILGDKLICRLGPSQEFTWIMTVQWLDNLMLTSTIGVFNRDSYKGVDYIE